MIFEYTYRDLLFNYSNHIVEFSLIEMSDNY